ncbi:MAG: hypothetical protein ACOH2H_23015 [Cypionkella sp.]
MQVNIGAHEWGGEAVLGLINGFREGNQSWRKLLLALKHGGRQVAPKLVVGDGTMEFQAALHEIYAKIGSLRGKAPQDGECAERFAKVGPTQGQDVAEGHLDGRNPSLITPLSTFGDIFQCAAR